MANVTITDLPTAAATPDSDDVLMFDEDGTADKKVVTVIFDATSTAFAALSVTTAKFLDDNVTAAKLETQGSVTPGAFTFNIASVTIQNGIITAITQ